MNNMVSQMQKLINPEAKLETNCKDLKENNKNSKK